MMRSVTSAHCLLDRLDFAVCRSVNEGVGGCETISKQIECTIVREPDEDVNLGSTSTYETLLHPRTCVTLH